MDVQNKPGYLILQSATEARSLGSCSSCMLSGVIVSSMASFSLILGPGQVKQVTREGTNTQRSPQYVILCTGDADIPSPDPATWEYP